MRREAMLKRLETAGLADRAMVYERTVGELLVTWLTPLFLQYETIEQVQAAGGDWVYGDAPEATKARLRALAGELGERVCALWAFEGFAAEIALDDVAEHLDELWFPASDDLWLLSLGHRRFVLLHHDELFLFADLGGPVHWPVLEPHPHP
jgi:hypothetical protein